MGRPPGRRGILGEALRGLLWRGAGGGGVLAGTRRQSAAGDGVPPSLQIPPDTHTLLARSPAPYSPFRGRAQSPTAFSGPMARPPPVPPRPPPSHMHAGWMVYATKTPTSSAPSQDSLFPLYVGVPIEATPLSATSAELVLGLGLGLGLGSHSSYSHASSHAPLLLATFHTISHSLAFTSCVTYSASGRESPSPPCISCC